MSMDMKQKTLLVITLVAVGYLGYQVYGLMKEDMKDPSSLVQTANAAEPTIQSTVVPMPQAQLPAVGGLQDVPMNPDQKAYLHMVNQYELAKMKRRLLEERAAIATAEHRIAALDKQTREIDASYARPTRDYTDNLISQDQAGHFHLSYVDLLNGQWSATLNKSGRYFQVHVGSALADGSKIINISRQGVVLEKDDRRQRVTFDGVETLPKKMTKPKKLTTRVAVVKALTPVDREVKKSESPDKKKRDVIVASNAPQLQRQSKDGQSILNLPAHSYTIQLIGSYHHTVVRNFAITNHLKNNALTFYVMSHGKRWYMLVYGAYSSRQRAQEALNKLPSELTPKSPWVRSVAGIQKVIRLQREMKHLTA